jgi:hypothetical protein
MTTMTTDCSVEGDVKGVLCRSIIIALLRNNIICTAKYV